jgi:MFS family permease
MGGVNSICFSLLTDFFSPKTRAIAVGIQSMSFIFGGGSAYLYGALLNDRASNWVQLYYYSLIPSLILALLIFFTMIEPERGSMDDFETEKETLSLTVTLLYLIKRPSFFLAATCVFHFF